MNEYFNFGIRFGPGGRDNTGVKAGGISDLVKMGLAWESTDEISNYNGVRPVITLKNDIYIDTSDSSKDGSSSATAWEILDIN